MLVEKHIKERSPTQILMQGPPYVQPPAALMEEKTASGSPSSGPVHLPSCKLSFRSKKSSSEAPASPDVWGVPLVSRAYDQDFPYEPVDPFKPSLLYSIRHIFPETPQAGDRHPRDEFDLNESSAACCHGHSHLTPGRAGSPLTRIRPTTILEYPFSPHHPSVSTTRPLTIERKIQRSHTADNHDYVRSIPRKAREARYSSPYPSPSGSFNRPIGFPKICSPRQQDYSVDDLMPSPIYGRQPASAPSFLQPTLIPYQAPNTETGGPQARPTSRNFQDEFEGNTLTILPNSHYLDRIPRIGEPPGPRYRHRKVAPQLTSPRAPSSTQSLRPKEPRSFATRTYILAFVIDTLPRQIYLYLLLCLPYMYFSRVAHLFEEAEISLPKIKQAVIAASRKTHDSNAAAAHHWRFGPSTPSTAYLNLQKTWEFFVDSLMREWKTLNIISVLLLSAILAILQIEMAFNDPITVYTALLSMLCALMSLLYGCVYIIRFGSMRKVTKAAMWAAEAQRTTTCLLWNVWVFLAMPAVWLAWSMVMYLICIMSLVWRTGSTDDPTSWTLTASQALIPRTIVTVVLGLGLVYFALIMNTLRRYGYTMDRAWHKLATGWVARSSSGTSSKQRSVLQHQGYSNFSPQAPLYREGFNSRFSSFRSSDSSELGK